MVKDIALHLKKTWILLLIIKCDCAETADNQSCLTFRVTPLPNNIKKTQSGRWSDSMDGVKFNYSRVFFIIGCYRLYNEYHYESLSMYNTITSIVKMF